VTKEISEWLGKLGLSEYAQRFAENGIDISVLRYLSDQDLEKIGVLLGHRRKILAAVADLAAGVPTSPQPAFTEPKPQESAERRQVTVMFSDLVGSTALSARMDPEDLREVISNYQRCVAETVQRFGGFVAKYMGDGVLIYFGYPQAHEDDAEKAVRAAAVGSLRTALIKFLKGCVAIDDRDTPPRWLDGRANPAESLLVFRNCLVDCETGEVSGLTPALWAHDGVDFGFDPQACAPRWQEFLGQIFDDQQSRDTLEEMLGYCMTYDTKFDKGFVLCGVKRSGKTTVLNMLEKLIGSGSYIGMSFSTLRNENSFQDAIGKKAIAFPDARFRPERTFFASFTCSAAATLRKGPIYPTRKR
jgi:SAM domain (Sterile alpha motif)/Adenylate and Guanylate cyclase catalytic domain